MSLVLGGVGGIPGIIAVVDVLRRRARFLAAIDNLVSGQTILDGVHVFSHVILFVTISNDGDRPIIPSHFDLDLKLRGRWKKWVRLQRFLIPFNAPLQSDAQQIEAGDIAAKDLRKFRGSIVAGEPLRGVLAFLTTEVDRTTLQSLLAQNKGLYARLSCTDTRGKTQTARFWLKGNDSSAGHDSPQHDLKVRPKPK